MLQPTVLLTGFGPFPGVEVNATSHLVPQLAVAARQAFAGARIRSAILPTEWREGLARLRSALSRNRPAVALHFGVSQAATGFVIERQGVNECHAAADGAGLLPRLAVLDPNGSSLLQATLPTQLILARLQALGLPAQTSDDAGRYLCNAVLYRSLMLADPDRVIAGFIHLPSSLVGAGADGLSPHPGCPLTMEQAVAGSLAIIDVCLARHLSCPLSSAPPGEG